MQCRSRFRSTRCVVRLPRCAVVPTGGETTSCHRAMWPLDEAEYWEHRGPSAAPSAHSCLAKDTEITASCRAVDKPEANSTVCVRIRHAVDEERQGLDTSCSGAVRSHHGGVPNMLAVGPLHCSQLLAACVAMQRRSSCPRQSPRASRHHHCE